MLPPFLITILVFDISTLTNFDSYWTWYAALASLPRAVRVSLSMVTFELQIILNATSVSLSGNCPRAGDVSLKFILLPALNSDLLSPFYLLLPHVFRVIWAQLELPVCPTGILSSSKHCYFHCLSRWDMGRKWEHLKLMWLHCIGCQNN